MAASSDENPDDQGGYHDPQTVDELTRKNVETIVKLDEAARKNRTASDRIADGIATFCGSMWFVWLHVVWFGGWIAFNTWPGVHHVDAFPYTFLTLIVSLEAIFLSTFILISQNHSSRLSERRNHLDLQINLLAEQETTKMLRMLEAIAKKVDAQIDADPTLAVLDSATQPEKLAEQIEAAIKKSESSPI